MPTIDTDALISQLASDAGIPADTVRKWRSRGKVPHHMRHRLAEAASDAGYILRTPHFDNFGRPNEVAA